MRSKRLILVVLASAVAAVAVVVPFAFWQPEAQKLRPDSFAPLATEDATPETSESISDTALQHVDVRPRPMTMLTGGMLIDQNPPDDWSHLVLHAKPRVAEGDVDRVSKLVNRLAGLFHLVVVAKVGPAGDGDSHGIETVAIGLATDVEGVETTVASQNSSSAKLDFMERTALSQNEASVKSSQQVARTKTMFVFDSDTIMWREGDHLRTIHRHAVLAEPKSGRLATIVWALAPGPKGRYRLCGESLQRLPDALREDRLLHVDANKFTLGIPTQESFGLVRVPPGDAVTLSPTLHEVVESRFDRAEDAVKLESTLRAAIGWDRRDQRVSHRTTR